MSCLKMAISQITKENNIIALSSSLDSLQGRRNVYKSDGASSNMVGILSSPRWNRVNWSAKIWRGMVISPPPLCQPTSSYGPDTKSRGIYKLWVHGKVQSANICPISPTCLAFPAFFPLLKYPISICNSAWLCAPLPLSHSEIKPFKVWQRLFGETL